MQLKLTFIRILFSLFFHFLEGSLRISLGKNKTRTERHFPLILDEKAFVFAKSFRNLIAFHAGCIRVARRDGFHQLTVSFAAISCSVTQGYARFAPRTAALLTRNTRDGEIAERLG
ncbi:hypothetical protein P5673_022122 [Acropora cervicornis]|uniref:Uncharacterized protein n=1 Tax=Acropora cervicornis TaxID=6130 RepID=A0AAD9V0B7_ACRCE|nr:hypothetical protein P5673_022122 [Acropora cervicornis]